MASLASNRIAITKLIAKIDAIDRDDEMPDKEKISNSQPN